MDEQAVAQTLSEETPVPLQDHTCTAVIDDIVAQTSEEAWDTEQS